MAESMLQSAGLHWHAGGDVTVEVQWNGQTYAVHVPVSSVRFEIRKAAMAEGLHELSTVGDLELVGWFGSSLWKKAKKAVKSVYKKAKKVAKSAVHGIKKAAQAGHTLWRTTYRAAGSVYRTAGSVLSSKTFGGLLMASSLICPAIGGPALGAYLAARGVKSSLDAGGQVAKMAAQNVRRLASGRAPTVNQQLLLSALRSYQG
jgi:hypothetical protein